MIFILRPPAARRCVVLLLLCFAGAGVCEDHPGAAHHERYAIGLFVGSTREDDDDQFTLGVEAGYMINRNWSAGAVVERADRRRESTLYLAGLGWHPRGSALRVQVGVGRKDPAGNYETVYRLGVAYEFGVAQGWFVKPYLALDFIEHHDNEEVVGLYLGRAF